MEQPHRPWGAALVILGGLALVLGALTALFALPAPLPPDHPESGFSAARAMVTLEAISRAPHPVDGPQKKEVLKLLRTSLEQAGLKPQVLEEEILVPAKGMGGRVSNLLVTIPGTSGPGELAPILFLSHHDTVPFGPGASDNGSGVVVLTETARALATLGRQGWKPKRDIQFLWTDGEESGQLGAEAYLARTPVRPALAVNVDTARDTPLFIVAEPESDSGVLQALAGPGGPRGYSWIGALTQGMNFDSDYSPFRRAGVPGASLVSIAFFPQYHTAQDTLVEVHPGAVQQAGDLILGLARTLGDSPRVTWAGEPSVYGFVPGLGVVHHPTWMVPALFMGVLFLVVLAFSLVFLRGQLAVKPLLRGLSAAAGATLGAVLLGLVFDGLVKLVRPEYLIARYSSHLPWDGLWALTSVGLGVFWVVLVHSWLGRNGDKKADWLEGWVLFLTLGAAALSWWLPEAAFLAQGPAALGAVAMLASLVRPRGRPFGAFALLGVPTALLWGPVAGVLYWGKGMDSLAFLVPLTVVALGGWMPLLATVIRRPWPVVGALGGLSALGLAAAWFLVGFSPACPQPTNLGYVFNADSKASAWFVLGGARTPWQQEATGAQAGAGEPFALTRVTPFSPIYPSQAFPAPTIPLPPPQARLVQTVSEDSLLWYTVEVTHPGTGGLQFGIPRSVPLKRVQVGGQGYEAQALLSGDLYQWTHRDATGVVTLRFGVAGEPGPVPWSLVVAALTDQLPPEVKVPPLPGGTQSQNDSTMVVRTFSF